MENTHQRICGDRTLLTAHATPPFVKKKMPFYRVTGSVIT